ncbi:MAG: DUF4920 domain-containing protein [Pseudobdellovibrionaceae bacterium]|nr:DUF4920 domain-containing protein [Bdellovibrionales bacterium]USN47643.1 MAG: DUF4920 domain-containing protein [Pseudobdellovibrionaceae bacterium]
MFQIFTAILLSLCLFSPFSFATSYGKGVQGEPTHNITDLAKNGKSLSGTYVRVKGKITDVCPMTGCWMELEDTATGQKVRVQVEEGVIQFPTEAKGKMGVVEGKLVAKQLSHKKSIRYFRHLAKDKGQPFDPKSVTGPVTLYEIEAVGAEL